MAFPKLLQKLFQNNGAGTKLRSEILPDIPYSSITGAPTTDSALSATSTNPVQNKVIKAAIDSVSTSVSSSGYQVGDLRLYAGTDVPDGWFRCDGSTVANMQTNYPKLFAFLGTNVLPNYSVMLKGGSVPVAISSTAADKKTVSFTGLSVHYTYSGFDGTSDRNVFLNRVHVTEGSGSGSYDFKPLNETRVSFGRPSGSWSTDSLKASVNLSSTNCLSVLIKHD